MERIFKAVICGELNRLYYITLDESGKKRYFLVDSNEPEKIGGINITAEEYKDAVDERGHLIFVKNEKSKYFSLMIQGLYIPFQSMYEFFLFQCSKERLFQKFIACNENDDFDHHDLLEIEKKLLSNPGLSVAVTDKFLLWQEDHEFKHQVFDKIIKICNQHGYVKIKSIFKNSFIPI